MKRKPLIGSSEYCLICGSTKDLHRHHIFYGSNRAASEKYNLTCYLCARHHNMSDEGVHFKHDLDLAIKQCAQAVFESKHSHEEFMAIIGRNYLGGSNDREQFSSGRKADQGSGAPIRREIPDSFYVIDDSR